MAGALAVMGVLHFVAPRGFDEIVPPQLPGSARAYTYASGAAELAVAAALALPATRRAGGCAAVALFSAVYPANIYTLKVVAERGPWFQALALARLPFQYPMIKDALRIAHTGD